MHDVIRVNGTTETLFSPRDFLPLVEQNLGVEAYQWLQQLVTDYEEIKEELADALAQIEAFEAEIQDVRAIRYE